MPDSAKRRALGHRGIGLKANSQRAKSGKLFPTSTGSKRPPSASGRANVYPPKRNGRKPCEADEIGSRTHGWTTTAALTSACRQPSAVARPWRSDRFHLTV